MRGWLAAIRGVRSIHDQIAFYRRLAETNAFFNEWHTLPFDESAADQFQSLRDDGIRIGSQDLKIASITLTHDALLLSANLRDFEKVPDLRVEDWLH